MAKVHAVTSEGLEEIRKALKAAAGENPELATKLEGELEKFQDGLTEIDLIDKDGDEPEIDTSAGDAPDPVADVMLGVDDAVGKILKAKTGDKAGAIREVLEKGYQALTTVFDETAELNYVAGMEQGKTGGTVSKTFKAKKNASPTGKGKRGEPAGGAGDGNGTTGDNGGDDDMDKILKGASGPVQALVEGILKRNTDLSTRIGALEGDKAKAHWEAVAKDAGEAPAFAVLLQTIAKTDSKQADEVAKLAKTKNEAIRKGGLFVEVGGGAVAGSGASALDQLNAKAQEIFKSALASADPKAPKTIAKSFTAACQANPDLYREYKTEMYGPGVH